MLLSEIIDELKIKYTCSKERNFKSLGLVEYNFQDEICTFVEDIKYFANPLDSRISVVITNKDTAEAIIKVNPELSVYIVEKPRTTFFKVHNYLSKKESYVGCMKPTTIGKNCKISPKAIIAEENVTIGDNCVIEEGVIIRENTIIGDNVIIRASCVLGATGFEYKQDEDGMFLIEHVGKLIIGNNVEIKYTCSIDKAIYPWDATIISDHAKIDTLVHIAHGVKIGEQTMVIAQSGIGGRVTIGKNAWIGFATTIRNGITIGDNAEVNMGAVVTKSVGDNKAVSGNFAIDHGLFIEKIKNP